MEKKKSTLQVEERWPNREEPTTMLPNPGYDEIKNTLGSAESGADDGTTNVKPSFFGEESGREHDNSLLYVIVKRVGRDEDPCLHIRVNQAATVLQLKTMIREALALKEGDDAVPIDRLRLIHGGRMLTANDDTLCADINMKLNMPNYVHMTPIPKGFKPSLRRRNENLGHDSRRGRPPLTRSTGFRHPVSQERRRARMRDCPYRLIQSHNTHQNEENPERGVEGGVQTRTNHLSMHPADSPISGFLRRIPMPSMGFPESALVHGPHLGLVEAINPVDRARRVLHMSRPPVTAMTAPTMDFILRNDVGNDIQRRTGEILPLCRALPDQLMRSFSSFGSDSGQAHELMYHVEAERTATLLDQVAQRGHALARSLRLYIQTRRTAQVLDAESAHMTGYLNALDERAAAFMHF